MPRYFRQPAARVEQHRVATGRGVTCPAWPSDYSIRRPEGPAALQSRSGYRPALFRRPGVAREHCRGRWAAHFQPRVRSRGPRRSQECAGLARQRRRDRRQTDRSVERFATRRTRAGLAGRDPSDDGRRGGAWGSRFGSAAGSESRCRRHRGGSGAGSGGAAGSHRPDARSPGSRAQSPMS